MNRRRNLLSALVLNLLGMSVSHAQVDLAGQWTAFSSQEFYEHVYGPALGDYMGVPLTAEGRAAALQYIGSRDEEL